jgi:chromosome segregation ATPase
MKAAIVFLIIVALGLGVGLLLTHNKAVRTKKTDEAQKVQLTNEIETVKKELDDQEKKGLLLQTNLNLTSQELTSVSNNLIKMSAELAKTQKEMQAAAEAARAEIEKRDAQIAQLTSQTNALTIKMDELTVSIDQLGAQIADTERKLAASEGDREFLLKELKRLQAEKAELERQFHDLAALRTQVAKLKEELSIARRLEWIRMGIYGMQEKKGAEKLMQPSLAATVARTNFNLNVELKQDGGATITSPQPPAQAPK